MSKLEEMRVKAQAAANRRRLEREADDRVLALENNIRRQVEEQFERQETRRLTQEKELRDQYPALQDAYEQYLMIKAMCENARPKKKTTLDDLKKAFAAGDIP